MEVIVRIGAAALLAAAVALLLRRSNPELNLPLAALVCAFALFSVLGPLKSLRELLDEAETISALSPAYFQPVLKCVGIGITAKLAADLCRDGGQSAMAGAVELGGTAAALFASLPLMRSFFALLQGLL